MRARVTTPTHLPALLEPGDALIVDEQTGEVRLVRRLPLTADQVQHLVASGAATLERGPRRQAS